LDMMDQAAGIWPECTPFFSTFLIPGQQKSSTLNSADGSDRPSQILDVGGGRHELSLYIDTHRVIATAVAVLALGEQCDPSVRDIELRNAAVLHPRYTCRSHAQYIAHFALPPYVEALQDRSCLA
jgi:hypothetical protein